LPVVGLSVIVAVLELAGVVDVPAIYLAAGWVAIPALILLPALRRVQADLQARYLVERVVYGALLTAACISIVTTVGIILSVLFEAIAFFSHDDVSVVNFFFGTEWNPGESFLKSMGRGAEEGAVTTAEPSFGALPLFAGTFMITAVAMTVAVPIGLLSAIFLAEYAGKQVRRYAKPVIELLAGIPTVVYGFFAAITVAPIVVEVAKFFNIETTYQNALTPGLIMGVMIIPFMSSLCDDVITALPQNLRRASFACGATRSETIVKILLPAALPGIISAFLLAISRAVGETMIVVMAAGLMANLSVNPLEEMTTVTVHIVANLTGDLAYDNPQTLSAFGLGLTLLVITLALNVISLFVVRRFRVHYEGD